MYLNELKQALCEEFGQGMISLVTFGMPIKKRKRVSDVDMIIVLADHVDLDKAREKIFFIRNKLQKKAGISLTESEANPLLRLIERWGGIHVSPFICRERDFRQMEFSQIFGTNKILTELLAPKNCVFAAIKHGKKVVYGKDLTKNWNPKITALTRLKGFLMSFFLALFAIALIPANMRGAMKFSHEAMKRAMLNAKPKLASRGIENAYGAYRQKIDLTTFLRYRQGREIGLGQQVFYILKVPFYIIRCYW